MTTVAAVDCGTNSVRLLITNFRADIERRMEIVRLGQGVDRTGRLAPEALERTFAAMRGYAKLIKEHGAEAVRVVATSATRDAANRDEFVTGVREIFGVDPEVITGDEEARLSFTGATRELGLGEYLVVDIGGGSTEFVLGSSEVRAAKSVDIGCVRLTERHHGDPDAAVADIDAALESVDAALDVRLREANGDGIGRARTLVGLAGSVTTVAGIALDLPYYDPERIHHAVISADVVHGIAERLAEMSHDERAAIPVMHPGRVDVIVAGALILDRIMQRYGFASVTASEHDILDGIALDQIRP